MDGSINGSHSKLLKFFRWKIMLPEEVIAHIAGCIDINRVIDMSIGIQIRPSNFILTRICTHEVSPKRNYIAALIRPFNEELSQFVILIFLTIIGGPATCTRW